MTGVLSGYAAVRALKPRHDTGVIDAVLLLTSLILIVKALRGG